MTVAQIAEVCHEANRAYCRSLGDRSHMAWASTSGLIRASAEEGVKKILDGVVLTPFQSHASWMAYKVKEGWVYGPVKDEAKKRHPCIKPYEELPIEQRVKDTLFFAIVSALRSQYVPGAPEETVA